MEVYLSGGYDHYTYCVYFVMVDGKVYDTLHIRNGVPLTHSEMIDVASYYEAALLEREDRHDPPQG